MNSSEEMQSFYDTGWPEWYDMKEYGPASKHVRRLVFHLLAQVKFNSILDAGCGVATLLNDISRSYPHAQLFGLEYSADAVDTCKKRLPQASFWQQDLSKGAAPAQADMVTCIDVLEHIEDDLTAMKNLAKMTRKYVLIVVPLGPLFEAERVRVGHVHGYSQAEFDGKLMATGFKIIKRIRWGFPFYNLYRRLLHILPEKTVTGKFSPFKRFTSYLIYLMLYANLPFWGDRYFLICEKVNG
jgi:SAM-dependent methyltransferase